MKSNRRHNFALTAGREFGGGFCGPALHSAAVAYFFRSAFYENGKGIVLGIL
jgi:hypothetical protein